MGDSRCIQRKCNNGHGCQRPHHDARLTEDTVHCTHKLVHLPAGNPTTEKGKYTSFTSTMCRLGVPSVQYIQYIRVSSHVTRTRSTFQNHQVMLMPGRILESSSYYPSPHMGGLLESSRSSMRHLCETQGFGTRRFMSAPNRCLCP